MFGTTRPQEVYRPWHYLSKRNLSGGGGAVLHCDLAGGYPTTGYPHPQSGTEVPHLGLGYPTSQVWGTPPGRDLGPVTVVCATPRKDTGPVEVLWERDGVPPGKDMRQVEVLWDGDAPPPVVTK